jgi:hypothetical protein
MKQIGDYMTVGDAVFTIEKINGGQLMVSRRIRNGEPKIFGPFPLESLRNTLTNYAHLLESSRNQD